MKKRKGTIIILALWFGSLIGLLPILFMHSIIRYIIYSIIAVPVGITISAFIYFYKKQDFVVRWF